MFGKTKTEAEITKISEAPEVREQEVSQEDFSPVKKMKLSRPIMINAREYTELEYNFEDLTSKDLSMATKLMGSYDMIKLTPQELDHDYHFFLFVKAVQKVNPAIDCASLMRLNAKDGIMARKLAREYFFINSEELSTQNN